MTLDNYIYIKENAFTNSDSIIEYIESLNSWSKSLVRDGDKDPARISEQLFLNHTSFKSPFTKAHINALVKDFQSIFRSNLREYLDPYKKYCNINQDEGMFILKYNVGGEYKPHSDGDTGKLNRRISGLIYLNDDYDGGELYFPNTKLKIKPKKGMLVLFPSNFCFVHSSLPITKGTKYTLVTWFR